MRGVYCAFIVEERIVSDTAVHEIDHTMCVAKNLPSDEAMEQLLEASDTVDHVCRQMSPRQTPQVLLWEAAALDPRSKTKSLPAGPGPLMRPTNASALKEKGREQPHNKGRLPHSVCHLERPPRERLSACDGHS